MSVQPGEALPDDEIAVEGPRSVMENVADRRRARRRSRSRTPALPSWVTRGIGLVRTFVKETVPEWLHQHRQHLITGGVSFFAHLLVAMLLALWVLPDSAPDYLRTLLAVPFEEEIVEPVELAEIVQPETLEDLEVDSTVQQVLDVMDETSPDLASLDLEQDYQLQLDPSEEDVASLVNLGELGGRSSSGKQAALRKYGGTAESERAVNSGLRWLQNNQQFDGSWSFGSPGPGARPGRLASTDMGATSMALLCFLGAGHTHRSDGEFRETVSKGIEFLMKGARGNRTTADLRGAYQDNSGMYVQGLATIVLCEAYAMEPDDSGLKRLARKAVHAIEMAQDKKGGGWRYAPGDAGDTSVVGWQVMALHSAKSAGIAVSRETERRVELFLDSVQEYDGARYKYMPGRRDNTTPSMTSAGLLCRMYLGWRHDNAALESGVGYLSEIGPSGNDMYYNYYATQVVHHWGGETWRKWNAVMREQLVERQITEGPAAGSWIPRDPHAYAGGQIYETALCLLTLEIYYRHLPLYQDLDQK